MANFFAVACVLTILFALTAVNGGAAPQSAPSQSPTSSSSTADCTTLIYDMMDCMSFLSKGGDEKNPDKSCCSGFKTVVETNSECICYALSSSASLGLDIDMTKAASLPSACAVSGAPPISSCGMSDSPVASPVSSSPVASPVSNSPVASPVNLPEAGPPSDSPILSPTMSPAALLAPAGAPSISPAAAADVATSQAGAPSHRVKSSAYTVSATFSVVFTVVVSILIFNALA